MIQTGILGARAEKLALSYLKKQGLKLIEKNFHSRFGELDLIMQDGEYLVFVEVRFRSNKNYGGAIESIDFRKQSKLRKTAELYLIQNKKTDCACRFDILCVGGKLTKPDYHWIENAF